MIDLDARTMDITPFGGVGSKCSAQNRSDQLSGFYIRTRCSAENTVNGHNADLASTDEEDLTEPSRSSPSLRARKTKKGLKVIYPEGFAQASSSPPPTTETTMATAENRVSETEVTSDRGLQSSDPDHQTTDKDVTTEPGPSCEPPRKKKKKLTKKKRTSIWVLAEELKCCYCAFTVDDRRLDIPKLNQHLRDDHLNQLYVCPGLGCRDSYFYLPSSLRRHMNKVHRDKVKCASLTSGI